MFPICNAALHMRLVAVQSSGVVFAIGAVGVVSEAGVKTVKQGD